MATITIEYDATNTVLKKLIEVILSLGAKITESDPKKSRLQESVMQIEKGELKTYNSVEEMFEKLKI